MQRSPFFRFITAMPLMLSVTAANAAEPTAKASNLAVSGSEDEEDVGLNATYPKALRV